MNKPCFSLILSAMLIGSLYFLPACSGGGGDGSPQIDTDSYPCTGGGISIDIPTSAGTFTTTSSMEFLAGQVNANYADVRWRNASSGASGAAGFYNYRYVCGFFFPICMWIYDWYASVSLNFGSNPITIDAYEPGGTLAARICIDITRLPRTPNGLTATAAPGQISLSWDAVPNATAYDLYWSTSSAVSRATGTKVEVGPNSYTHTGLQNGTTYYYLVTALSGTYESPPSPTVFATPGWHTEVLASFLSPTANNSIVAASIASDSAGSGHIFYSYVQSFTGPPYSTNGSYYLSNATGPWTPVAVDIYSLGSSVYSQGDDNIAVAPNDTVHISYVEMNNLLTHAVYSAGSWTWERIDSNSPNYSSFALDQQGNAHAAYCSFTYDAANNSTTYYLKYATNTTGAWVPSIVHTFSGYCNGRPSLAIDQAGTAHIAYAGDSSDAGLKYATKQGGSWSISSIDPNDSRDPSIAVDNDGKIHVAYRDNTLFQVKYAHNVSGAWAIEPIDDYAYLPSLALGSGLVHVAYVSYAGADETLNYASNLSGTWQRSAIDRSSNVNPSITVDLSGNVHITYFDSSRKLKYATNK